MKKKHQMTLKQIFARPVSGSIRWADIEALFVELGAEVSERAGSRIAVVLFGEVRVFHRPHPAPDHGQRSGCKRAYLVGKPRSETMNNVMTFEDGYKAVIAYDPEIEMFRGEFVGLNGAADFYAADLEGLKREGKTRWKSFWRSVRKRGSPPRSRRGALPCGSIPRRTSLLLLPPLLRERVSISLSWTA